MLLVELLLMSGDFDSANHTLTNIRILPYEGGA